MVEKRQSKLQANAEAIERWQRKLFRAANELQKLTAQRKRLLGPKKPSEVKYRSLDEIRMACGGAEFNDELPG
jgi:protein subunit release factor A